MQVEVDVKRMHTNFGGHSLSSFRDFAPFCLPSKQPNFPFGPWSSKNLIHRNRLNKFMQIGFYVKCMYIDFGWRGLSCFGDTATSETAKISLWTMDYIVHGGQTIESLNYIKFTISIFSIGDSWGWIFRWYRHCTFSNYQGMHNVIIWTSWSTWTAPIIINT